jgi:hypothetical protein
MGNSLNGEFTRLIASGGVCAADFSQTFVVSMSLVSSFHGEHRDA